MFRSKQFVFALFLLSFLFCGCNPELDGVSDLSANKDTVPNRGALSETVLSAPAVETTPDESIVREVLESYSDDRHIGQRRHNKIEIDIVNNGPFRAYHPTNLAIIRFYSREPSRKWELKQTLEIEDDALEEAHPKFQDFSGDKLKDVTFITGTAARGANEIRTLLIYDKTTDKLIHIENSKEFPNIEYNKKLKCVDAWRVYGGTATDFAQIEGNRLRTFAIVENFDGLRTVSVFDPKGRERIIRRDKISSDDLYTRYSNFRPLEY